MQATSIARLAKAWLLISEKSTFETGVLENEGILHRLASLKKEHGLLVGLTASGANQVEVIKRSLDVEVNRELLFDVFQVTYNIFDQSIATLSRQFESYGRRLVIKEAMANGRVFPNDKYPHYQNAYGLLLELAEKYKVGIDAIALRYCIESIPSYKVLSGAAIKEHLIDNLKAESEFIRKNNDQLSQDDLNHLNTLQHSISCLLKAQEFSKEEVKTTDKVKPAEEEVASSNFITYKIEDDLGGILKKGVRTACNFWNRFISPKYSVVIRLGIFSLNGNTIARAYKPYENLSDQ